MNHFLGISVVLLLIASWQSAKALKCNAVGDGTVMNVDCSDQNFGNNKQTCMVSITNSPGGNETIVSGCLPTALPESECGKIGTIDGKTTSMCCCNSTENCNDDLFTAKCRNGTAPTSKPPGFQCYYKAGKDSSFLECSNPGNFEERCMATKIVNSNTTMFVQSCVPKGAGDNCGKSINGTTACCCDTTKCNDQDFLDACITEPKSGSVTVAVTSFGFLSFISILASSILA